MKVIKNLVDKSKYPLKCPYSMTAQFIVVHNTANDASARNEVLYMTRNTSSTGFHYAIDDREVVQGIPETRNAFHAGDGAKGIGNRYGLSVEICYSKSGGERFLKAEANAVDFIADKLREKGWDISKVRKHQDFSGKYCPHRTLDLGWERFLKAIGKRLEKVDVPFLAKVTADSLNYRTGPSTSYPVKGVVMKGEVYTIVDVSNGWGRLKSGAGWVNLKYCTKV